MPTQILLILGIIILGVVISGLVSGKIIAGSKGLEANYYSKKDNPLSYYAFIVIYSLIAIFIFYNSI